MKLLVSFLCFFCVIYAIPFYDCGSEYQLQQVEIENCKYLPCPLFMNDETNVDVKMGSGFVSKSLKQEITLNVKAIKINVTSNPAPCTTYRPCPINGNDASFSAAIKVPETVPFLATLHWVIINDEDRKVMCFSTNVILCTKGTHDSRCYQE